MKFKTLVILFCLMSACLVASGVEYDRYIVRFNDNIRLMSAEDQKIPKNYASVSADELQDYIDAGVVKYYEPDYLVELHGDSWNHQAINANFPGFIGCLGNDVTVGVIDSGIADAFASSVMPGHNYIDGTSDVTDTYGHGTEVTALISSNSYGYATKVNLVPLKCFDEKTAHLSTIIDGLVGAVNDYDCDVINMSLGLVLADEAFASGYPKLLREKVMAAADLGIIIVSTSGNDSNSAVNYPGGFEDVVSVGSIYQDAETLEYGWSSFSNYNDTVWVTAPGQGLSLFGQDNLEGTSYAAPHVTALAAIAKCIDPKITPAEFKTLLANTSTDLGAAGKDIYYGHGLINCEAAIKQLISDQKMHISPIEKSEGLNSAVIYNNTDKAQTVYCICAYFDADKALINCIPLEQTIDAGKTYTFENSRSSESTVKYMVWSNLKTMIPMGTAKEK